jgi:hypothetical protein
MILEKNGMKLGVCQNHLLGSYNKGLGSPLNPHFWSAFPEKPYNRIGKKSMKKITYGI